MNVAFRTGVSGLMAYQEGLNLVANNVANINTDGFKPSTESFRSLVNTNMDVHERGEELMYGHGVRTMGGKLAMKEGNLRQTSSQLDFAIIGDGFFGVKAGDDIRYTRNGAMGISAEEDGNYLVTSDGFYVVDAEGERIAIPYGNAQEDEDNAGTGNADEEDKSKTIDQNALMEKLGVFRFNNPYGLAQNDGCKFSATATSGNPIVLEGDERSNVEILSNTLEASAVDMADEMVAVMQMQKAYQFSAKLVQTADQIEDIVNNLR